METIQVIVLPGGQQVREINKVPKPVVGFYDFYDPYDVESFERAKAKWYEAEDKCRRFDVSIVDEKPYPHMALGAKCWFLIPEKEHTAVILNNKKTVKIIK